MNDTAYMRSYGSVSYSTTSGSSGGTNPMIDTLRFAGAVNHVVVAPLASDIERTGLRSPWVGMAIRLYPAAAEVTQNHTPRAASAAAAPLRPRSQGFPGPG